MTINNNYWQEEFNKALEENINDVEFLNFLNNPERFKKYPIEQWGVWTKYDENGVLVDIRMLVPEIVDELTLRINLHKYKHAYEYYQKIGTPYKGDIEKS